MNINTLAYFSKNNFMLPRQFMPAQKSLHLGKARNYFNLQDKLRTDHVQECNNDSMILTYSDLQLALHPPQEQTQNTIT